MPRSFVGPRPRQDDSFWARSAEMPWTSPGRMASDAPVGHIGWARCPPKQQTSPKSKGGDAEGRAAKDFGGEAAVRGPFGTGNADWSSPCGTPGCPLPDAEGRAAKRTKKEQRKLAALCADGETRTHTGQRPLPPQSSVSTISPRPRVLLWDCKNRDILEKHKIFVKNCLPLPSPSGKGTRYY